MKKLNIYFFIFYLIRKCLNYTFYHIKLYDKLNKIENLLLFNSSYTTLEMGTPPQKVDFYFSLAHSKMYVTNLGCKKMNLFNSECSSSLFVVGEPNEEDPLHSTIIAMETLLFTSNMSLTEKMEFDEFPLYYYVDINKEQKYLCGNIGLSIMPYETFDDYSDELEYYIKFARSQNNYFSFFNYKGQDFFVNSIYLHQEFKDIFKDVQTISWVNPLMRDNYFLWEISMNDIYYNKVHFKDNIILELNPLFELIIGNNDYKKNIKKDFFNFYIDKKICQINTIREYEIFECDSNKFTIKDIQKFPNLYMYNIDINHVFDLIGEELFIELNNKIFFKIIFEVNNENNKWIMGKIFLRKFPTIFSPSNRIVGFYIKPNEGKIPGRMVDEEDQIKNNTKKNTKNILFYILIIFISFVFSSFCLFIGRKLVMSRQKKMNELIDDYYEYNTNDKKEIKKKDVNKNHEKMGSKEMEMASKI